MGKEKLGLVFIRKTQELALISEDSFPGFEQKLEHLKVTSEVTGYHYDAFGKLWSEWYAVINRAADRWKIWNELAK